MKRKRVEKQRRRWLRKRKEIRRRRVENRKRRIERRLKGDLPDDCSRPMFRATNIRYEVAERSRGHCHGGIGVIHKLAIESGLVNAIDKKVHLLKMHVPYHESDHVLNIAYNTLCGGTCLEDIELRRNDEVFLDALGTDRLPDPTTAGDFCRRFVSEDAIHGLMDAVDDARLNVWSRQPDTFFEEARIDMDGSLVETTGECKQGMDIAYNGVWGYHPLIVSLANTGEVLRIVNRSGSRPSHEGAAVQADRAIALCLKAGFRRVCMRGDTDFSQTKYLDRWDDNHLVRFVFGVPSMPNLEILADDLPDESWTELKRPPRYIVDTTPRIKPERIKEQIVEERQFENIKLLGEDVAEFNYRPNACRKDYRMIVVRKNLVRERFVDGQKALFETYRYFFYLTNDRERTVAEIVFAANNRCDQENLIAQLKGSVRSLRAPVDNLLSNWSYMVMTALAWNLKAWCALWLPERSGRWIEKHRKEKHTLLRMEFKTFLNAFVRMPCQVVKKERRIVYRLLAYNPWQPVFFRLADVLRC